MQYSHTEKQSQDYTEKALKRIYDEGLPSTPDIFELWYVYYSGQSPEVKKAVDVLINNKQKVTAERARELHHRFLSEAANEELVRKAGDQVHSTIRSVSGAVRSVKSATESYQGKLGDVSARIEKINDPGELRDVLVSMMEDTGAMMQHNQHLEEQLDQSAAIMEELQKNLEEVRKEAMTDGLTGLANRKAFDLSLSQIVDEASAEKRNFHCL